jgi:hypothetical protein
MADGAGDNPRMNTKSLFRTAALCLALLSPAAGLAACGSDDDTSTTDDGGRKVEFTLTSGGIDPDRAQADPGDLELVVSNESGQQQTIVISGPSGQVARQDIKSDAKATIQINATAGQYTVASATDQSVSAVLVVGAGSTTTTTTTTTNDSTTTDTTTQAAPTTTQTTTEPAEDSTTTLPGEDSTTTSP